MQTKSILISVVVVFILAVIGGYYYSDIKQQREMESSYFNEAWDLYYGGNYQAAIALFSDYIDHNEENAAALNGKGWSHYYLEEYEEAVRAFTRAAEIEPDEGNHLIGLGWSQRGVYQDTKTRDALEEAEEAFREATELLPDSANAHYGLGLTLYQQELKREVDSRNFTQAIRSFEKALELNSYSPSYLGSLAISNFVIELQEGSDFNRTLSYADRSLSLDQSNEAAHLARGFVYIKREEYEQAREEFEAVLSLNPQNAAALSQLAWIHFNLGRTEEALEVSEEALSLDSGAFRPLLVAGWVHVMAGEGETSENYFQRAIDSRQTSHEAYYGLGLSHYIRGGYQESVDAYERSIELNPQSKGRTVSTYAPLGWAYYQLERYPQAIEAFQNHLGAGDGPVNQLTGLIGMVDTHLALGDEASARPFVSDIESISYFFDSEALFTSTPRYRDFVTCMQGKEYTTDSVFSCSESFRKPVEADA